MECIFCKIIQGKIPSSKVYEDESFVAFLDISPVSKGHTLLVPKEHYENMLHMPETLLEKYLTAAKKVSEAVKRAAKAEGLNITFNLGRAAGQSVMHAHLHIIPRFGDDGLKLWPQKQYKEGEAEEIKNLIIKEI